MRDLLSARQLLLRAEEMVCLELLLTRAVIDN